MVMRGRSILMTSPLSLSSDDVAARSFEATRRLCGQAGLRYRVMSDLDKTLDHNLRLLLRYRDPRWTPPRNKLDLIRTLAGRTVPIRALADLLSEDAERPEALGWIFWMIWMGQVSTDLRKPLGLDQLAHVPGPVLP